MVETGLPRLKACTTNYLRVCDAAYASVGSTDAVAIAARSSAAQLSAC